MKILTLWQPWASLVADRSKLYETRSWGTDYRGLIAIHAAKRPVVVGEVAAIYDELQPTPEHTIRPNPEYPKFVETLDKTRDEWIDGRMPLGAIVVVCELTECFYMVDQDFNPSPHNGQNTIEIFDQTPFELAIGNWAPGRYAWQLSNILKLPQPIPWKGSQGLTDLPQEAVDLINQQGFSGGHN